MTDISVIDIDIDKDDKRSERSIMSLKIHK